MRTPLALVALLVVVLASCGQKTGTRVIVLVNAEESLAVRATQIELVFADAEGQISNQTINLGDVDGWPVRIAIFPRNDDASRHFTLHAELRAGDGSLGKQRVDGGFREDEEVEVSVLFEAECETTTCVSYTTCRAGACTASCVDTSVSPVAAIACGPDRISDELVALWSFDEGSGTVVHDRVTGEVDLTLGDEADASWHPGRGLSLNVDNDITSTSAGYVSLRDRVVAAEGGATGNLVVEAWVELGPPPSSHAFDAVARIVTLASNSSHSNLLIAQANDEIVLGMAAANCAGDLNGKPWFSAPYPTHPGPIHIVYSHEVPPPGLSPTDAPVNEHLWIDDVEILPNEGLRVFPGTEYNPSSECISVERNNLPGVRLEPVSWPEGPTSADGETILVRMGSVPHPESLAHSTFTGVYYLVALYAPSVPFDAAMVHRNFVAGPFAPIDL